jgi:LCP family protein required for cell wall assembly
VAVLLVVLLAVTAASLALGMHAVAPRTGPGDVVDLIHAPDAAPGSLAWKINVNERVNLLLMAHGGAGNDNPNFTDTMLVVSIRPRTGQTTVISLPRHLWVKIPAPASGEIRGQIYAAYALGAVQNQQFLSPQWQTPTGPGDLAAATVADAIGQPVDYWVAIDSDAFAALIDALGGVRATIPETLDDSSYPGAETGQKIHIHFDPGPQTLDGERAVEYARSRLSTSETDRSRRQELILVALLQSLRSAHLGLGDLEAVGPLVNGLRTNLRPLEVEELKSLVSPIRIDDVKRVALEDSGLLVAKSQGNVDILVPREGGSMTLQEYVAQQLP